MRRKNEVCTEVRGKRCDRKRNNCGGMKGNKYSEGDKICIIQWDSDDGDLVYTHTHTHSANT